MLNVYGIKNCDTMKKAFAWLEKNKIAYTFHDYKKSGADKEILKCAFQQFGWEETLNRKGTTWRNLAQKPATEKAALARALENPSAIRRPIIARGGKIVLIGFDAEEYKTCLEKK